MKRTDFSEFFVKELEILFDDVKVTSWSDILDIWRVEEFLLSQSLSREDDLDVGISAIGQIKVTENTSNLRGRDVMFLCE